MPARVFPQSQQFPSRGVGGRGQQQPGEAVDGAMSAGGPCPAGAGGGPGGASCAVGVSPGGVSMFRWLEVLEKEFDKAFVDVDLLLGEIDPDQADITYEGRQKMTSLSSCFAQLCHKAQTVSQINHKLEVSFGHWWGWHSTPVIRSHLTCQ